MTDREKLLQIQNRLAHMPSIIGFGTLMDICNDIDDHIQEQHLSQAIDFVKEAVEPTIEPCPGPGNMWPDGIRHTRHHAYLSTCGEYERLKQVKIK